MEPLGMIAAHFTDLVPFLYNVKTLKGIQSVKLASPAVHKGYLEELWLTLVNLDNGCKTAICNCLFVFDLEVSCYHFFHFSPHGKPQQDTLIYVQSRQPTVTCSSWLSVHLCMAAVYVALRFTVHSIILLGLNCVWNYLGCYL